ncbi:MAG: aminopeptidase P family protein [Lachnospiraceae bacterium]|nr:aminopeptidase P family protein [Lachnospiraceae bacterium]
MAQKELSFLRKAMKQYHIDWYLIPTDDYHLSEYVGDYFKAREWISGFSGSAGVLVAGLEEAVLFTDGRYFVQAEKELKDSGITLMRSGMEGVPTLEEYLADKIQDGKTFAFDGRVVSALQAKGIEEAFNQAGKNVTTKDVDLITDIWEDRPTRSCQKAFLLEEKYAGESRKSKLIRLREQMEKKKAKGHVIGSLDDIAWLYDIRGGDVECSPLVLSYAYITMEEAFLFIQKDAVTKEVSEELARDGISIENYDAIYDFLKTRKEESVLLYEGNVNTRILKSLSSKVKKINALNPTTELKAIKNPTEIANLKKCHIKDGVALTRFMYKIKTSFEQNKDAGNKKEIEQITEAKAAKYLDGLRLQTEGCVDLSFPTIAAFGSNGAMMHYSAKEEESARLEPGSFFLVDSGGQYYEGTTDVTRTMALGEISPEKKKHFTAVVRGMLNLMGARFLEGCKGVNLDILAREPMWEMDIDYRCGTGHGVGYFLNVHEGPNAIRWRSRPDLSDCELKAGMITTDEPGIYLTDEYGIRIENELLCVEGTKNEYGQFLQFETITFAPIDLDGIDPSFMNQKEKESLNEYHRQVYEKISPFLSEEERQWLKRYTRPIK